jgi:flagellar hook-basal body complex protein FliE
VTLPVGEGIPLVAPHQKLDFEPTQADKKGGVPFADTFANALKEANDASLRADAAQQAFAAGRSDDIHGTMIAVKEADIELRLVATVRNKLVDAFNDLWRVNL